jgi:hypothetical protein
MRPKGEVSLVCLLLVQAEEVQGWCAKAMMWV